MLKIFYRYLLYGTAVTAGTVILMVLSVRMPDGLLLEEPVPGMGLPTSEFSPVELLQNMLLIFCAGSFCWIAARDRLRRPMAVGFIALFLVILIRELDFFLDYYLVDNLWQVLCALLVSVSFVYIVRNRRRYVHGWRRSWPSAGLALIIGGFILLIPFAQLLGHEAFWQALMQESYVRVVKVAAEELLELGAYTIITLGSIEFLYAWSRLPRTRNLDARPRRRGR
ncbi:MAG: hypothetical protein QF790_06330 [Gammaproteobacteria bacterium]|jgi:hypothetical protein|nr:hypothetical protein [Gammaproteobacteria bacterium]MDP6616763.1 hypothetical protein [Gammaproteobacteria bacterium]MDP6695172.1 hypothetical protein [Gammaproteobacteria bacterium]MDP7041989.1 hypothetical protein [Gammaproteobacteria bacterium]